MAEAKVRPLCRCRISLRWLQSLKTPYLILIDLINDPKSGIKLAYEIDAFRFSPKLKICIFEGTKGAIGLKQKLDHYSGVEFHGESHGDTFQA